MNINERLFVMRRPKTFLTILSLLFFLFSLSCERRTQSQEQLLTPEVSTITVSMEAVELVTELPGRVSSFRISEVRPQVSGLIVKRFFNEGSDVKVGQVLYQIDPAPFEAALSHAKAALGKAEAQIPAIKLKVERFRDLLAERAVSQQDYDEASAALKQALAEVEYWKASVKSAEINLGYTKITAPISGRIGKSNVTEGAIVTAYQQTPLVVIHQLDPVYVDVTQSTTELLQLKKRLEGGNFKPKGQKGSPTKIILEDGSIYPREGFLQFRDVTVDPTTGSVTVRVIVPNPDFLLLPGMYVRAVIFEGINDRAILVPQQSVQRDRKNNPFVLVVNGEHKVEMRPIVLERAIGDKWLVASGLSPGDRIIVEGIAKVKPGMVVKEVPFARSPY
ncbi:MAG: efflux RND transporter periplasmic adaptor subunit [Syntrophobacterales bacterium]|nr:efflux RND transporter periplasmic adaptor subunit [Syntrophobacterales bacterium]